MELFTLLHKYKKWGNSFQAKFEFNAFSKIIFSNLVLIVNKKKIILWETKKKNHENVLNQGILF